MPSRIDEAGHTKAFDYPVAEQWGESQRTKRSLVGFEPTSAHTYESKIQRSTTYATPTSLYGCKHLDKVNGARFYLFCTKNSQSQQLPPTQNALKKHTARANYQAAVWKRALDPQPDVPSLDGHGWTLGNGILNILWTHQEPAPKILMQYVSCGCKTPCGTRRCSCKPVSTYYI